MKARRLAHRIHRWMALAVGLQVAIWLAGGLLMSAIPIERVRGEHKIAPREAVTVDASGVLTLAEAMKRHEMTGITSARLIPLPGGAAWQIADSQGAHLMDAQTGAVLPPLSEAAATAIAVADYAGPGQPISAELLAEPPAEYARPGPIWRVVMSDADRTALYVSPESGEVTARRGRTWRTYDLAWRLHVMDYDDGESFNHPLLVTAAGAGALFALSGLFLTGSRLRQSWRQRRLRRLQPPSAAL